MRNNISSLRNISNDLQIVRCPLSLGPQRNYMCRTSKIADGNPLCQTRATPKF